MVNPGLVMLVVLMVVITIAVIVLSVWAYTADLENQKNPIGGITGMAPCYQTVNFDTLVDIPPGTPACNNPDIPGNYYCINTLSGGTYDYVVTTAGSSPLNVCIGFCTGYSGGVCSGPDYSGKSAQINFDNCLKQLTPTDCIPPLPLAKKGTILYYAAFPTCRTCNI